MHAHTNAAAETHAFNPQAWLDDFKRYGGYWLVIGGQVASVGVFLDGNIEHEQHASAALTALRQNPQQREAVRAYLIAEAGRA